MALQNWVLLVVLSIFWGGSFYFIEKALVHFSTVQVVFFRVFFAAVCVAVVLFIKKVSFVAELRVWGMFFVMACLNNVIPFLSITYAQESISASLASLFNATTPIFTALLAHVFTKDEPLTKQKLLGVCIGFLGMAVLLINNELGSFELVGFFALLGALSYAFAGVYGKKLRQQKPLFNVFGMLSVSSIIMGALFFEDIKSTNVSSVYLFKDLLLLAIFSTALAYMIYFRLLFSIGALKLLLVTYLIPISALLLGVMFLHEEITRNMYLGSGIIFLSLYCINKEKNHTSS